MASRDGPGPDDLNHFQRLVEQPQAHHIFHALRVIEAHFRENPPLGASHRPREDRVRLSQEAELAFPPTTIRAFTPPGQHPGELVNRFFGYFGPHGPLPIHLTEYVIDRKLNHRDPTLAAFLNTFTHRFMSLLYRTWTTGQPAVDFDRGAGGRIDGRVAALAGLGSKGFRDRDAMPDMAKLHFAGFLAPGPRHPDGLVAILSAFFKVPVRVQEFIGSWLALEPDDRWQLGARAGLGQDTSIGTAVYSRAAKFRLRIGPLGLAEYNRLLPGGDSLPRLVAAVRGYMGDALDWDVNLVLKRDEVPKAILGGEARLGMTTWIGDRRTRADAGDLYLTPALDGATGTAQQGREAA